MSLEEFVLDEELGCVKCGIAKDLEEMWQLKSCNHLICKECLRAHLIDKGAGFRKQNGVLIPSSSFNSGISCPKENCFENLDPQEMAEILKFDMEEVSTSDENSNDQEEIKQTKLETAEVRKQKSPASVSKTGNGERQYMHTCGACKKKLSTAELLISCRTPHYSCFACITDQIWEIAEKQEMDYPSCPVDSCKLSLKRETVMEVQQKYREYTEKVELMLQQIRGNHKPRVITVLLEQYDLEGTVDSKCREMIIATDCNLQEFAQMAFRRLEKTNGPLEDMKIYIKRKEGKVAEPEAEVSTEGMKSRSTEALREAVRSKHDAEMGMKTQLDERKYLVEHTNSSQSESESASSEEEQKPLEGAIFEKIFWMEEGNGNVGEVAMDRTQFLIGWSEEIDNLSMSLRKTVSV